jgi:hypothetical protein
MDTITHTVIAIACMYGAYCWGKHLVVRDAYSYMLDWLEEEKFVKIEIDENGEKVFVKLEDES